MFSYHKTDGIVFMNLAVDDEQLKLQLKKILSCSFAEQNMDKYFPKVAKVLAHKDIVIKKMACWYIARHCKDPSQTLLVLNTLFNFCNQSNPLLKVIALKTLLALPIDGQQKEYVVSLFMNSLRDQSPLVRRVAVLGCLKLHKSFLTLHEERKVLVEHLITLTKDNDTMVSLNSILILTDIMGEINRGFTIDKTLAVHITNNLEKHSTMTEALAVRFLKFYNIVCPKEALELMNALEIKLTRPKFITTRFEICSLFFSIVEKHLPHLEGQVHRRCKPVLFDLLSYESSNISYGTYLYLKNIIKTTTLPFKDNYNHFLWKTNDPHYLKQEKLLILFYLINQENYKCILRNIKEMLSVERSILTFNKAVHAFGTISRLSFDYAEACVSVLLSLASEKVDHEDESMIVVILSELLKLNYKGVLNKYKNKVTVIALKYILCPQLTTTQLTDILIFFGSFAEEAWTLPGKMPANNVPQEKDESNKLVIEIVTSMGVLFRKMDIHEFKRFDLPEGDGDRVVFFIPEHLVPVVSALLTSVARHLVVRPAGCELLFLEVLETCSMASNSYLKAKAKLYKELICSNGMKKLEIHFQNLSLT